MKCAKVLKLGGGVRHRSGRSARGIRGKGEEGDLFG